LQLKALARFCADACALSYAPSLHVYADQRKGELRILENLYEHWRRNGIFRLRFHAGDPEAERGATSGR